MLSYAKRSAFGTIWFDRLLDTPLYKYRFSGQDAQRKMPNHHAWLFSNRKNANPRKFQAMVIAKRLRPSRSYEAKYILYTLSVNEDNKLHFEKGYQYNL